jgi:hypothetical protein
MHLTFSFSNFSSAIVGLGFWHVWSLLKFVDFIVNIGVDQGLRCEIEFVNVCISTYRMS